MRKFVSALAIIFGFALPAIAWAQMMGWDDYSSGSHMGWFWPMAGGGMFIGLIIWVLIIVAVIYLVKWLARGGHDLYEKKDSAVQILKERYAKGEINKEELEEKMKDIMK
ncbi:MAG: SHOCT domain-containing protein [bacterium]